MKLMNEAFAPFSVGARSCAGGAGNGEGRARQMEFQLEGVFISTHNRPYLVFRPRGELRKD